MKRYVFLDRDGTLVDDVGYPHRLEDYALLAGVPEALGRLRDAGYALAIVTNQSGIGRGLFGPEEFGGFGPGSICDRCQQIQAGRMKMPTLILPWRIRRSSSSTSAAWYSRGASPWASRNRSSARSASRRVSAIRPATPAWDDSGMSQ